MVINLKNKIKSPISISCLVVLVGIIAYAILSLCFVMGMVIGCYKDVLKGKGWEYFRQQSILGYVYGLIGIDIRKAIYLKLIVFNMIHIGALIFMALITWTNSEAGLLLGFIYIVLWVMAAIGFIIDFRMLKNQVKRINKGKDVEGKDHINQPFKSPYIKIFTGLVVYAISLFVLAITADESQFLGFIIAIGIGSVITVWSMRWARSFLSPIAQELAKIDEGFQNAVNQELVSQRMKTELISNVSHDLKTPLTSIINYVDLLKNKDLTQEQQEEYVGILD